MVVNEVCIDCQWNKFPLCDGTIDYLGTKMNIENLNEQFQCGQKNNSEISDDRNNNYLSIQERLNKLENRIQQLESK